MDRIAHVPSWILSTTLAVSAVAHLVFGVLLLQDVRPPDLELELQLPSEVEFGLTEAVTMAVPPAPTLPPPVAAPTEAIAAPSPEPARDAGPPNDAGVSDAGHDGGPDAAADARSDGPRDAGADGNPRDAGADAPRDAGADGGQPGNADAAVGSRLPPGAQIAVRINMVRIRQSPIADDVRGFLAVFPDWKALLDGSGIRPVDDLDRVLIATPNLQRSRIVVAGRYSGGRGQVEAAVAKLGAAKGVDTPWRLQERVPVAPWANVGATARVVALIGPEHFSISREEDLPRLLAVAAARSADGGFVDAGNEPLAADALLSMGEHEGMSLEVEGVREFVRRGRGIPTKLRISATETDETQVRLDGRWVYDDAAQAEEARLFWDSMRRAYGRNTMVALLGLSAPLASGSIERDGRELRLRATLTVRQTRLILGYVRELITPPPPFPPRPAPPADGSGRAVPPGAPAPGPPKSQR